jgi:hypothetical protein
MPDSIDALVIFGATGDLAKLLPGRDTWYDPAS